MNDNGLTYLTDAVLINCIVPLGRADEVIKAARDVGVAGAVVYHARGVGVRERLGLLGIAVEAEKEVVSMIGAAEHRDVVMRSLYARLGLDRPGAGLIYAIPLDKVATYVPEAVRERLAQEGRT